MNEYRVNLNQKLRGILTADAFLVDGRVTGQKSVPGLEDARSHVILIGNMTVAMENQVFGLPVSMLAGDIDKVSRSDREGLSMHSSCWPG